MSIFMREWGGGINKGSTNPFLEPVRNIGDCILNCKNELIQLFSVSYMIYTILYFMILYDIYMYIIIKYTLGATSVRF